MKFANNLKEFGRGAEIRTPDLLVPNQALYQAEPRPEEIRAGFAAANRRITQYNISLLGSREFEVQRHAFARIVNADLLYWTG